MLVTDSEPGSRVTNVRMLKEGHINNLYNTTFWALIQQGQRTPQEAEKELTVSGAVHQPKIRVMG